MADTTFLLQTGNPTSGWTNAPQPVQTSLSAAQALAQQLAQGDTAVQIVGVQTGQVLMVITVGIGGV